MKVTFRPIDIKSIKSKNWKIYISVGVSNPLTRLLLVTISDFADLKGHIIAKKNHRSPECIWMVSPSKLHPKFLFYWGGGGGGASQENGGHPLPGIGGLFGEGFPKLRSAGQSGAGTSARKPFKVPSSSNQGDKTRNKMFSSKDTSWDQQKSLVYVKSPKMTIVGTIWVLCKHLDLVSSTCNKVGKT